jgi:hypothetical protein
MNQLCWIENFVVGGYYGFELSWVNFVADYHILIGDIKIFIEYISVGTKGNLSVC